MSVWRLKRWRPETLLDMNVPMRQQIEARLFSLPKGQGYLPIRRVLKPTTRER
jgi:hypothetical protein